MNELSLIHGTHFHGRFEGRGTVVDYAEVVAQERERATHMLYLGTGDDLSPSVLSRFHDGTHMVDVLNRLGLDCNVFGNHDFDLGPATLVDAIKRSAFPWVCCNLRERATDEVFARDAGARTFETFAFESGNIHVGVTGIVDQDVLETSNVGKGIEVVPPVEAVEITVRAMRDAGVDVTVVLSQLPRSEARALAQAVDVDILCAFDVDLPTVETQAGTVVSASTDLYQSVNVVRVAGNGTPTFQGYRVCPVSERDAKPTHGTAREVARAVERWERDTKELAKRVATVHVPLDARFATLRHDESGVGNAVADAIRWVAGSDVGLITAGAIRGDDVRPAGELTRRAVLELLPFENHIVEVCVTGADLRAALEHGVSAVEAEDGRFPHVSNARYKYDSSQPIGDRIVAARVASNPLDRNRRYTLATTGFIAGGGNGYEMLVGCERTKSWEETDLANAFTDYVHDQARFVPVREGRIDRAG